MKPTTLVNECRGTNNVHVVAFADNVCIEAMSVNISGKTLDRSQDNLEALSKRVRE